MRDTTGSKRATWLADEGMKEGSWMSIALPVEGSGQGGGRPWSVATAESGGVWTRTSKGKIVFERNAVFAGGWLTPLFVALESPASTIFHRLRTGMEFVEMADRAWNSVTSMARNDWHGTNLHIGGRAKSWGSDLSTRQKSHVITTTS